MADSKGSGLGVHRNAPPAAPAPAAGSALAAATARFQRPEPGAGNGRKKDRKPAGGSGSLGKLLLLLLLLVGGAYAYLRWGNGTVPEWLPLPMEKIPGLEHLARKEAPAEPASTTNAVAGTDAALDTPAAEAQLRKFAKAKLELWRNVPEKYRFKKAAAGTRYKVLAQNDRENEFLLFEVIAQGGGYIGAKVLTDTGAYKAVKPVAFRSACDRGPYLVFVNDVVYLGGSADLKVGEKLREKLEEMSR